VSPLVTQFLFAKVHPLDAQLIMSHYSMLFLLNEHNEIDYYINKVPIETNY